MKKPCFYSDNFFISHFQATVGRRIQTLPRQTKGGSCSRGVRSTTVYTTRI